MQRAGSLEIADTVMIDHTKDGCGLQALNRLGALIMVGEDYELAFLNRSNLTRLRHASVGKKLCGLGRQSAQSTCLVGVAGILNLIEKLGQHDSRHDGVVIGVLVAKNKNVSHGFSSICTGVLKRINGSTNSRCARHTARPGFIRHISHEGPSLRHDMKDI